MKTPLQIVLLCLSLLGFGNLACASKDATQQSGALPRVKLVTSLGDITLELYADKAPITVKNFLEYVDSGHYNGSIFHRVIDGFMIQGGGLDETLNEKATRAPIALEANAGLSHRRGTIAMARRADPHSATAQFFINVVDNPNLDFRDAGSPGYAVFGRVIAGMDVVDKIKAVPVGMRSGHRDVPLKPIVIHSAVKLK